RPKHGPCVATLRVPTKRSTARRPPRRSHVRAALLAGTTGAWLDVRLSPIGTLLNHPGEGRVTTPLGLHPYFTRNARPGCAPGPGARGGGADGRGPRRANPTGGNRGGGSHPGGSGQAPASLTPRASRGKETHRRG